MKNLVHLSRAFVEFGPFTKKEILDFHNRCLLADTDYLRDEGSKDWLHYNQWLALSDPPAPKKPSKRATSKTVAPKKARKVS